VLQARDRLEQARALAEGGHLQSRLAQRLARVSG
jgi:hypothetical protein